MIVGHKPRKECTRGIGHAFVESEYTSSTRSQDGTVDQPDTCVDRPCLVSAGHDTYARRKERSGPWSRETRLAPAI